MNIEMLKEEFRGWKKFEVLWMTVASFVILGLSIYWKDTLMGIISSISGVICVVCTGKGKLSAYVFGLINSVLYAIISYRAQLYGETMLNAFYYVPMQFVGFYVWSKHMNRKTHEVTKRHMHFGGRIVMVVSIIIGTVAYGFLLKYLNDAMPFVDAFTTVASVVAMVVSVRMYSEQWWIWIAIDIFTIYMWACNFWAGSDNMATLLMWVVFLLNAIIMCIRWEREIKKMRCENGSL